MNCGYEESRREQARHHEALAQRGKALRDTRIRNIHEVRESHATIQELTSQIQELRERMNDMSDSGEFQDVESWWNAEPRPKFAT